MICKNHTRVLIHNAITRMNKWLYAALARSKSKHRHPQQGSVLNEFMFISQKHSSIPQVSVRKCSVQLGVSRVLVWSQGTGSSRTPWQKTSDQIAGEFMQFFVFVRVSVSSIRLNDLVCVSEKTLTYAWACVPRRPHQKKLQSSKHKRQIDM